MVVADDHPLFRDGVVRALSTSGFVTVVAEAANGREALDAIREHLPDVALLDHRMPELDGVEVTHAVRRDGLATRVVILSAFTSGAVVHAAISEGVTGYLSKDSPRAEIVEAVLAAAAGRTVLPAELAAALADEVRDRSTDDAPRLTEREREVLTGMAAGKSVPAMAKELFLAPSTVKTHVQKLYEKLGVNDRGAAVAEAMRRGLLE